MRLDHRQCQGLWDMHVHTGSKGIFFPLYIANGITGIRERGDLIGPRMVIAGFLIDGFPWPGDVPVSNPPEARAAVDALHDMGVDFIKVKSFLSRDAYLAVADEAHRKHIVLAGHVPDSVSASEASGAGQKSIEHLTGVALAISKEEGLLGRVHANEALRRSGRS